jgi:hypothetical protein
MARFSDHWLEMIQPSVSFTCQVVVTLIFAPSCAPGCPAPCRMSSESSRSLNVARVSKGIWYARSTKRWKFLVSFGFVASLALLALVLEYHLLCVVLCPTLPAEVHTHHEELMSLAATGRKNGRQALTIPRVGSRMLHTESSAASYEKSRRLML